MKVYLCLFQTSDNTVKIGPIFANEEKADSYCLEWNAAMAQNFGPNYCLMYNQEMNVNE